MTIENGYFVGVDVGTQSVRAGLITPQGAVVSTASQPIKTYNSEPDVYEQSSDNIWSLCVSVIRDVTRGIDAASILGIGFDATCSLVAIDKNLKPLSVSNTGKPEQNIILWMDHRAVKEADFINELSHKVLKYVGGKISPEMQPPKLLWLKNNMPQTWEKAGHFFDLPDFLTWKATVCKWTYQAGDDECKGWRDDFWISIGLDDVVKENYSKFGTTVVAPGNLCGDGLSEIAAKEMGLLPGTPVSVSIIDAHAGGLGILLCNDGSEENIQERMALICGTSTCHMKVNKNPIFTPGVWGPYYSAMVPDWWCSEAGQSAAGALLDHIVSSHPASTTIMKKIASDNCQNHITDVLNQLASQYSKEKGLSSVSLLTKDFHVYPDFHGNRSPLANSNFKGMVCGLTLTSNEEDLLKLYVATVQALACGTKFIIKSLEDCGHSIKYLLLCGGLSKNSLYVQTHADVTGLPVIVPYNSEPVLLGSAMLAASASKYYKSVIEAMVAMSGKGLVIKPDLLNKKFYEKKYEIHHELLKCQSKILGIVNNY